jgi:hypothetical protein
VKLVRITLTKYDFEKDPEHFSQDKNDVSFS